MDNNLFKNSMAIVGLAPISAQEVSLERFSQFS
jgi:hypothetical protein